MAGHILVALKSYARVSRGHRMQRCHAQEVMDEDRPSIRTREVIVHPGAVRRHAAGPGDGGGRTVPCVAR